MEIKIDFDSQLQIKKKNCQLKYKNDQDLYLQTLLDSVKLLNITLRDLVDRKIME